MNFGPTPKSEYDRSMKSFTTVIERDAQTGLFIGYVPGWPGAHSQGATLEELRANLAEVVGGYKVVGSALTAKDVQLDLA